MDNFILYFIIAILALCLYMYMENKDQNVVYEHATFDGRTYMVQKSDDSKEAANLLALIRSNLVNFCDLLGKSHADDKAVKRLLDRFNPDVLVENTSDLKNTSYSINKGEKVVLCIRSRDGNNRLEDPNILMFVALHELAHIMSESIGHTEEFWSNFRFLLKQAVKMGVYQHVNFRKNPVEYCGVPITDSPY